MTLRVQDRRAKHSTLIHGLMRTRMWKGDAVTPTVQRERLTIIVVGDVWKQSVVASVVREKSSELNVSPGERFYIAHLRFS